ncbi:structural protein [Rhodococcus phage ReqiPepy6]|uniref:Structural protein n=1 Tax=Rhodococcus phage ReqiPepy6 TaxID=691965 RepID=D4P7E5_9CAUD|nr:structural protein [Rhodococcus phage ReqiPepy6]ADD80925.1 structural protein [Rhodococcus phage ReqiPepy6]
MAISFETSGSFQNTERRLKRMSKPDIGRVLNTYGALGVAALKAYTPVDSSATANAWYHKVTNKGGSWELSWHNQNGSADTPIAIMLQYGHGTGTGGYVAGRDYINPAIRPIFDAIKSAVWKEVTRT